jgi:hypothetical protein
MGDDFENAFSLTYGYDHWASLRSGGRAKVDGDIWGDNEPPGPFKVFRNWLSRNSMVYRIVVHGDAMRALKGRLQFGMAANAADPSVTTFESTDKTIYEAFRPIRIAAGLDQSRAEVKEGMRITFHLLKEMDRVCREHGCELSVVIIPTKETVFAPYLQAVPQLHLKKEIDSIIMSEQLATSELQKFLDESAIRHVYALSALRQAVGQQIYYRGPADMHPSANGYKVIGLVAAELFRGSHAATVRN